jgi:hypothetical protein
MRPGTYICAVLIAACSSGCQSPEARQPKLSDTDEANKRKQLMYSLPDVDTISSDLETPKNPRVEDIPKVKRVRSKCDGYMAKFDNIIRGLTPPRSPAEQSTIDQAEGLKSLVKTESELCDSLVVVAKINSDRDKKLAHEKNEFDVWFNGLNLAERVKVRDWNNAFRAIRMSGYAEDEAIFKANEAAGVPSTYKGKPPIDPR